MGGQGGGGATYSYMYVPTMHISDLHVGPSWLLTNIKKIQLCISMPEHERIIYGNPLNKFFFSIY